MLAPFREVLVAAVLLLCWPVHADSLQCGRATVEEGDSRASLLQKCGPPQMQDSFCAPVFQNKSLVPGSVASNAAPCQRVDDWMYDRDSDKFSATVRIRDGAVQSIRIRRQPR